MRSHTLVMPTLNIILTYLYALVTFIKMLLYCGLVQLKFSLLTFPPLSQLLRYYIHSHTFVIIQYPSLYLHFLAYLYICVHLGKPSIPTHCTLSVKLTLRFLPPPPLVLTSIWILSPVPQFCHGLGFFHFPLFPHAFYSTFFTCLCQYTYLFLCSCQGTIMKIRSTQICIMPSLS